jgi:hypothetical protein
VTTYNWAELMQQAGGGFEPLPPSEYDVQVVSAEAKPSSTGKLMISVRFQVLSGPQAGRPVYNNFTLSPENPQALGFFFRHMKVLGLDENFFRSNPAPEQVAESLKGRQCRIKLGQKPYQGEMRNNVERISPLGAPGAAPTAVVTGAVSMQGVPAPGAVPAGFPPPPVAGAPAPAAPPPPPAPAAAAPPPPPPPAPAAPAAPQVDPKFQVDPGTGMVWNGSSWVQPSDPSVQLQQPAPPPPPPPAPVAAPTPPPPPVAAAPPAPAAPPLPPAPPAPAAPVAAPPAPPAPGAIPAPAF